MIVTKPWYPKTVRGKIHLADVVDQLMEVLENCDPDTYSEARQDVVNIYRCALSVVLEKSFVFCDCVIFFCFRKCVCVCVCVCVLVYDMMSCA